MAPSSSLCLDTSTHPRTLSDTSSRLLLPDLLTSPSTSCHKLWHALLWQHWLNQELFKRFLGAEPPGTRLERGPGGPSPGQVMKESVKELKRQPNVGCYIHGLFLEGARWDAAAGRLAESRPKELYTEMAVIWLVPVPNRKPPESGSYLCPIYKTLTRAGRCPKGRFPEAAGAARRGSPGGAVGRSFCHPGA